MRRRGGKPATLVLGLGLLACGPSKRDGEATTGPPPPPVELDLDDDGDDDVYVPFDPAKVTPLDVLYFPEPVGEGYRKTKVSFGPSLYSAKYLALGNGDAQFLTPTRIVVNELRAPHPNVFLAEIKKSVLLDVETGEVLLEFGGGRRRQWNYGLGIVYKDGDDRPYLLDAEAATLVLAVPEGEHGYRQGKNYWIHFSGIAKRVWIHAVDEKHVVHVYEWEDRSKPPELPANPVPFVPKFWEPDGDGYRTDTDSEEVIAEDGLSDCSRVVLLPPKGFECLNAAGLEDTLPLSDGWRHALRDRAVLNRSDGRGLVLSTLCQKPESASIRHIEYRPPILAITCRDDDDAYFVWRAPDSVQRLAPEFARKINTTKARLIYWDDRETFEVRDYHSWSIQTATDERTGVLELIGRDYDCENLEYRGGLWLSAYVCKKRSGATVWIDLVDEREKRRARVQAKDLAVNHANTTIAIVTRGGKEHVVRVSFR